MNFHVLDLVLLMVVLVIFCVMYPDLKETINKKWPKKKEKRKRNWNERNPNKKARRKKKWGRIKREKGLKRHNGKLIK